VTEQRSATQFKIRLPDSLINEIKQAAANNGQTMNQWCLELFEAALALNSSTPTLEQRIARIECAVAQITNPSPF
jgi:hypothetical protein